MIEKLLFPVILQIAGVAVIIVEFLVPTAGVLAITAIIIFGYSLYWVFTHLPPSVGVGFVAVDMVLIPFLVLAGIKLLASSRATLRDSLSNKEGAVSQPQEWLEAAGREGVTLTQLHPAGSALVAGKKYDVVSRGEYIEKGSPIVVVTIDGNRIVVKRKE